MAGGRAPGGLYATASRESDSGPTPQPDGVHGASAVLIGVRLARTNRPCNQQKTATLKFASAAAAFAAR